MDDDQQFCLRWNNHQSTLIAVFDTLLEKGIHVDCTLAAEGQTLKAHKVVLSACSPYFENVLSQQYDKHPIIILKDVKFAELKAMMDYMYRGEVNISQDQLAALLKAAESLQIKGLSDSKPPPPRASSPLIRGRIVDSTGSGQIHSREGSSSPLPRKRKKVRRSSLNDTDTDILNNSDHIPSLNHTASTVPVTPKPPAVEPIVENDILAAKVLPAELNDIAVKVKNDTSAVEDVELKGEMCEDGTEDSVEDLTLDEEIDSETEHSGPGPSHPQGDCVQSFAWHMDRAQDESTPSMDGQRDSQAAKKYDVALAGILNRTMPLTRGSLRGVNNEKTLLKSITRKPRILLKPKSTAKQREVVTSKGSEERSEDCQLPSALLSLLTAQRLQSQMSSLVGHSQIVARRTSQTANTSIHLFSSNFQATKPTIGETIIEKARLLQKSIMESKIANTTQSVGVDSGSVKCADGESDFEDYDDTDDILLPDESEVFYGGNSFSHDDPSSPYLFVDIKTDANFSSDSDKTNCSHSPMEGSDDPRRQFECRHCGKRYRWKSTLRRHENVECGGKPPSHQCPYCSYKAKQRGNLGVHIRKHHITEWTLYASNKLRKPKKEAL